MSDPQLEQEVLQEDVAANEQRKKSNRAMALVAGLLAALLVVGGLIWWVMTHPNKQEPTPTATSTTSVTSTPTVTQTPTVTASPIVTATATATETATSTATATETATASATTTTTTTATATTTATETVSAPAPAPATAPEANGMVQWCYPLSQACVELPSDWKVTEASPASGLRSWNVTDGAGAYALTLSEGATPPGGVGGTCTESAKVNGVVAKSSLLPVKPASLGNNAYAVRAAFQQGDKWVVQNFVTTEETFSKTGDVRTCALGMFPGWMNVKGADGKPYTIYAMDYKPGDQPTTADSKEAAVQQTPLKDQVYQVIASLRMKD